MTSIGGKVTGCCADARRRDRYYRAGSGGKSYYEFTNAVPEAHYLTPQLAAQPEHIAKATERAKSTARGGTLKALNRRKIQRFVDGLA